MPRAGNNISVFSLPLHFGKSLSGSHGGEAIPHEDIPRYHGLYQRGKLKLDELITDHFALEDINVAIAGMRSGKQAGRCLIKLGE